MKFQPKLPTLFANNLLSKLDELPVGKNILVIREFYTAVVLARNNTVTFVTDDVNAEEAFRKIVMINPDFGNDDTITIINNAFDKNGKEITNTKAWENWTKELKMKFDVAIMNPPYDRNLHLKILEKVILNAKKVVNISPVRWLQDPFAKYLKTSDYKKFEESISKKIETLDIIPAEEATKKFDNAAFTMNLGIYVCGNGGYQYDSETLLIKKIVKKVMSNSWENFSWQDYYDNKIIAKTYSLNVAPIHSKDSVYPIMCQTYDKQCLVLPAKKRTDGKGGMGHNGGHFEFDTENERLNFYNCYNHRFMQWYCRLWKYDVNVVGYKVPYFGDYTKPWTTKMFCDYFDITGYIDDEHAVPGSEWEEIMNQW